TSIPTQAPDHPGNHREPRRQRGPVWTPITPPTGSLFHADPHAAKPGFSSSSVIAIRIEVTFASGARLTMRGDVSPALLRELVEGLARR
ncbi:hypothetical protein, partial [Roseomonas indoligenes]